MVLNLDPRGTGCKPGPGLGLGLGPGPVTAQAITNMSLATFYQQQYRQIYHAALAAGEVRPLVVPWSFAGSFFLPLVYLSIPHTTRPWLYRMRWAVAAAVFCLNARLMLTSSAGTESVAYITGLIASWGTVWALRLLIFTRPQWDAARVERRPRRMPRPGEMKKKQEEEEENSTGCLSPATAPDESVAAALPRYEYVWQRFPADAPWLTRLAWTADLLTAFRGAGWNHAISTIPHPPPPPPDPVRTTTTTTESEPVRLDLIPLTSRAGVVRFQTYSSFIRTRLRNVVLGYLTIDLLTILMRRDAYFLLGPSPNPGPGGLQQLLWSRSLDPTAVARNLAALAGAAAALHLYTSLLQLAVCAVPPFPGVLGVRAELWQHPTVFGGFGEGVLDRGLAGFWGAWWHQTFRAGFVAPAEARSQTGAGRGKRGKGRSRKLLQMGVAFLLSGLLHAAGGLTSARRLLRRLPRRHWADEEMGAGDWTSAWTWTTPVAFFLLQPVGMLLQEALAGALPRTLRQRRWVRRLGNLAFVAVWLQLTAWGLVDDLSRAGLWLFEPVPVSLLRLLGFGPAGESWWRWDAEYRLRWYTGRRWWESGIRL